MKKTHIQPTTREREFRFEELFFSTTDLKGIITAGNEVFVRISGHPLSGLMRKPHNIIRHPHMPRAVFKLLWDYLLAGKSIAAYVKNMAANGDYYWVVALVTPIEDGFLSVRFKPSSQIFPVVQNLYGELLKIEQNCINGGGDWREGMQAATDALLPALNSLGFADYDAFMAEMLRAELNSREAVLIERSKEDPTTVVDRGNTESQELQVLASILRGCEGIGEQLRDLFSRVDSFVQLNEKLQSKSEFILDLAQSMRLYSLNANIEATRLGDLGRTLAVISHRMGESSESIACVVTRVRQRIELLAELLKSIVFNLSGSRLQIEMVTYFVRELLRGDTFERDVPDMVQMLNRSFGKTFSHVLQYFSTLNQGLSELATETDELDKVVQTLHFIRINGKVETARSAKETNFLSILNKVSNQIDSARSEFQDLEGSINAIRLRVKDFPEIEEYVQRTSSLIAAHIERLQESVSQTFVGQVQVQVQPAAEEMPDAENALTEQRIE